jgi:uncharacterized protein
VNDTITVGIRKLMLLPIYLYRSLISPAIKPRCRYFPSCSEYFELSVMRYGVLRGSLKGIYRILRCNPFASGGYDPP